MNFSKINELKPYDLNCNIFDVYSYNGLSMQELLCQFFTKINECVKTSNETIDLAEWLVNEGLKQEVALKLTTWLNDGTLENLINVTLFENLNKKIDNASSQLEHIEKHLTLNVKDFGAEGDGVTDDTNAIIEGLKQIHENGGGVLYFPRGTYLHRGVRIGSFSDVSNIGDTTIISSTNNITIKGEEQHSTIIKLIDNSNNDMFVFRYVDNIKFNNLTLDGNVSNNNTGNISYWSESSCLILLRDCKNVIIEKCKFINAQHFGVNISSSTKNAKFKNNIIDNCVTGLDVCGQFISIEDNHFSNCSNVALFLEGNEANIHHETFIGSNAFIDVINNTVIDSSQSIYVKNNFYSIKILNNNIERCQKGLALDSSNISNSLGKKTTNSVVKNNFITNCSGYGILLNNTQNSIVDSNICRLNLKGCYITLCEDVKVINNIFANNKNSGIELRSSNNNILIKSNTVKNNNEDNTTSFTTNSGIYLSSSNENITITENQCINDGNQCYGIVLEGNPKNIFINYNILKGNTSHPFLDKSGSSLFTFIGNITEDRITKNTIYNELNLYSFCGLKRNIHTNAPTVGTYKKGDIFYNSNPISGSYIGWVCIEGGEPGVWKGFGVIS